MPCIEPGQIRCSTKVDLLSSHVNITKITALGTRAVVFKAHAHTLPTITVKSEGHDSHLKMKEDTLRKINHFLTFPWQTNGRSETTVGPNLVIILLNHRQQLQHSSCPGSDKEIVFILNDAQSYWYVKNILRNKHGQ